MSTQRAVFALAGVSCNIDYKGRLTLCCNLSGFRGAVQERDIVADLHQERFSDAYEGLRSFVSFTRATKGSPVSIAMASRLYIGILFCHNSEGQNNGRRDQVSRCRYRNQGCPSSL